MTKEFFKNMDMRSFLRRIRKLKSQTLIKTHKPIYSIQSQLYNKLHSFLLEKSEELPCRFRNVSMEHIGFLQ